MFDVCFAVPGAMSWQACSMMCVVCSMLSKEQGVTALGFCVVYDFVSCSQVRGREGYTICIIIPTALCTCVSRCISITGYL